MKSTPLPPESATPGLHRSVGFLGVLGQSVAGVAPTTTPTINIALIFVVAGSGSWLAYLVAMVAIFLVAFNLVPLARRFAGAGSLSDLVSHGLGATGRLWTAWALLLAYLAVSVATLAGCTNYISMLFGWMGVSLPLFCWVGLMGGLAAVLAFRDIRLSTGLMLALECVSLVLIFLLCVMILVRQGVAVDVSQFDLKGLSASGMSNALLIGVLSFVGFEAAATLGAEARQPLRDIPRVLLLTPLLTGLFFVFSAYVIVLGFNRYGIAVATSEAPLDDLARALHRPGLGVLVALGASISLFACVIATMVAASRVIFSLARQGALPAALGQVKGPHSAPQRAVALTSGLILTAGLALATFAKPLDIYNWAGTFGTLGCVLAYALTCVATPIFLRRQGQLRAHHVIVSLAALGVLGYVIFGCLYPIPAAPMNFIPWLFLALFLGGIALSLRLIGRKSQI